MSKLGKFDVVGLLQEHGAILNGHFQIPSGFHTQTYIQPSLVLQYPHLAQKVAKEMAAKELRCEQDMFQFQSFMGTL